MREKIPDFTFSALLIIALSCFALGCSATVTPPESPLHPVAVYVADYGHHSSVFLPLDKTAFVEYSFGDWQYYAMNGSGTMGAIRELFFSQGSAFGRRYTPRNPDDNTPEALFNPRMFAICVSADAVDAVRDKLELRWQAGLSTRIYNADDGTEFETDEREYSWQRDCNEVTAGILRELGCEVEGATYLSHFHLPDDAEGADGESD